MKFKLRFILISIFICNIVSCIQEPENSNIPNSNVNFYIDVSLSGSDNSLADGLLGNSKIYTKTNPSKLSPNGSYGYSGVVVVRAYDNNLYAFDICCPYEADRSIILEKDGYFLKCPKCGSTFEIGNGTGVVNSGPATQQLKKYQTSQNSAQKVRIFN